MPTLPVYALLDLSLSLTLPVENPWDPARADVQVALVAPDGTALAWPAFWDGAAWRFRYRPLQEGTWTGTVLANGAEGESLTFQATAPESPGPLHVDGQGLRFPDGSPFVPLGLNLGWSAGGGVADYERWFTSLEEVGGTFARIWLTHFSEQDPEWPVLGEMNPTASANLDAILDSALAHGILLVPVLWQHSELECSMWSSWAENPYNAANGGPCADSLCFFTDPAALAHEQAFLRYMVARWGAHPAVGAWEIMNEMDGVTGVDREVSVPWARDRALEIRAWEGSLHPITWSWSLPTVADNEGAFDGADLLQLHSYLVYDVVPVVECLARMDGLGAVLYGEWGLDWLGNGDLADTTGLAWHNANWAALSRGAAGNAMTWWWDNHVEPQDLWWRLEGPARVVADLDLPAMVPTQATVDDPDLEVYARADGSTALAWIHEVESTVPEEDRPPVSGATLSISGFGASQATFRDTSTGEVVDTLSSAEGTFQVPTFSRDVAVVVTAGPADTGQVSQDKGCGCRSGGGQGWLGLALGLLALGGRRPRGWPGPARRRR